MKIIQVMKDKNEKKSFWARIFEKVQEEQNENSKNTKKDGESLSFEELQFFDMMED